MSNSFLIKAIFSVTLNTVEKDYVQKKFENSKKIQNFLSQKFWKKNKIRICQEKFNCQNHAFN